MIGVVCEQIWFCSMKSGAAFFYWYTNNCSGPQTVIVSTNHQFCCTTIFSCDRTTSNWWLLSTNQVSLAALSQCRIVAHTVIGDVQSCTCSMHQQNSGSTPHTECADTAFFRHTTHPCRACQSDTKFKPTSWSHMVLVNSFSFSPILPICSMK